MPIDTWFPLAIYYEDLAGSAAHKDALVEAVHRLREGGREKRTPEQAAWTGDVHAVEKIHLDPAFDWITEQVERHVQIYLQALGHDLQKMELYIQRSWPVISKAQQNVSVHAHYTANVSAVYYILVPTEGDSGKIQFLNETRPNEIARGISTSMTEGYSSFNQLNYGGALYQPIEGRLLVFPAKQKHEVNENTTSGERISLSYDLVVTANEAGGAGLYEFLAPSPSQWRRCARLEDMSSED